MVKQAAYVTHDAEIIEAVKAEHQATEDWRLRMNAALEEIPLVRHDRLWVTNGLFSAPELYALQPLDPNVIPDGWRLLKGKRGAPDRIEPRKGKPGETAREWLAKVQPPKGERVIIGEHGAPTSTSQPNPNGDGTELVSSVNVLLTDDAVHVLYQTDPAASDCIWSNGPKVPDERWEKEPLSSWYLALEVQSAKDYYEKR